MTVSSFDKLARWVMRRRWYVVVASVLATVALVIQTTRIRVDFSPDDLFASSTDETRIAAELSRTFGTDDAVVLILVLAPGGVLEPAPLQYVHDLTRHAQQQTHFRSVASITTAPLAQRRPRGGFDVGPIVSGDRVSPGDARALAAAVENSPLIDGKLIGRSRQLTVVAVTLAADPERNSEVEAAISHLERYIARNRPPEGVEVRLGGLPVVRLEQTRKLRADQPVLFPAAFAICLVILLVSFRWAAGVGLALSTAALSGLLVVGGMALAGEPINLVNNIVPLLVTLIALSDSIHLVNRYGEQLWAGHSPSEAGRRSLRSVAFACWLTSLTTAVGIGSLGVSHTDALRRFGITAALGIAGAYVVTVTFLPAALSLAPRPRRLGDPTRPSRLSRMLGTSTRWLVARRGPVLAGATLLVIACAWSTTRLQLGNAVLDQFDESEETYQTMRLLESRLDGVRSLELSLRSPIEGRFDDIDVLNAIDRVKAWASGEPGVLRVTSYSSYLREARRLFFGDPPDRAFDDASRVRLLAAALAARGDDNPVARFVNADRTRARINVQLADIGAGPTLKIARELRRRLADLEGVQVELTGDAYTSTRALDIVTRDLLSSLLLALAIIFVTMTVLFRSLRTGLFSLPIAVLPLLGTTGYMALRQIPLNVATVIIMSITVGLAVDGAIHVSARFLEERRAGRPCDDALARAVSGTGKANIITYVTLMAGFSALYLSSFLPMRRFGELTAITALGCLFSTLVVLPPLVRVVWRREWGDPAPKISTGS